MDDTWEEIAQVYSEGRHEIHLNGEDVTQKLIKNKGHLPETLFQLTALNYIEICDTKLSMIPDSIANLTGLIDIAFHRNAITSIPPTIGELKKLKFLDLSFNHLSAIPQELTDLPNLHTLNLGNNLLAQMPNFENLKQLGKLFVDHNQLIELPDGIYKLTNVSELYAANNQIAVLSSDVGQMTALKHLDVSENLIKRLPLELANCYKLKDLNGKDNPIADNRLKKMLHQCPTKSVLDYLQQHGDGLGKKSGKGKKRSKGKRDPENIDTDRDYFLSNRKIHVLYAKEESSYVMAKPTVINVRPHFVGAVIKDLDLSEPAMFKKFITLQTKIHENECDMRTKATIATHSMKSLQLPLSYEALPPDQVQIIALGKSELSTSHNLIEKLKEDREQLKQRKKRQPKSGLFKFIELVDGKELFCCVKDSDNAVISFPPITNSETTKVSSTIMDVFVEVTSPVSLPTCKGVMDELIKQMYQLGFQSKCQNASVNGLVLEQVRVLDFEHSLKVVYPSKVDLQDESFIVSHLESLPLSDV